MLGGINSVATETNADEVGHIGSNTLSNVVTFGIEISEARKPSVVKLEGIGPAAQRSLAVEVSSDVLGVGELEAWDKTSILHKLIGPVMRKIRRRLVSCCALSGPG